MVACGTVCWSFDGIDTLFFFSPSSFFLQALDDSRKDVARLQTSLMAATNRADESELRKQYEEGEITALVDTYRQKSTEATMANEQAGKKIAHLVTDLENSLFLEKENEKLIRTLSELNVKMKQTTLKLETSDKTNATLAVENIKLKKINQGNVEYYENVNATQKKRELHLLKKEKEWHQKEKNIEVIVNQKYISQIKDNAFKHNQIIKKLKEANVNDLEDLQHRLNMKCSNKIEKLKKHFDHKTQNMCHLHDEQTTRWNDERKKYEAHVKTEHDRTVAELNNNLLSEVDSISSEFRTIYNLAKERAEKHANEGWTSDVAKTRLLSENTELRQTIVDSNNKQNL